MGVTGGGINAQLPTHWAMQLVLGWVTDFWTGTPPRYVTKPTTSTQPCIPPGLLNQVLAGVKAGMSPLPGGMQEQCVIRGTWVPAVVCWGYIGRVSYKNISMLFLFPVTTVRLVQASLQYLMHHVTVSLQQSKITLQNNCINNTSITQLTLSFYFWLKM